MASSVQLLAHCGGSVPRYELKVENNKLYINLLSCTERLKAKYNMANPAMSLMREPVRQEGRLRILGLSKTPMDKQYPRYSTSENVLNNALKKAEGDLNIESRILFLSEMNSPHCKGFCFKSEKACSWPSSITKMDSQDEMIHIYEGLVHWADVVVVATTIRWGSASSLYYKMAERLNSVQNQITLKNKVLIKNKVASFIITGGQDNIQALAGQMVSFFSEQNFKLVALKKYIKSFLWVFIVPNIKISSK
ncbi:MAG: flavodoxin family protein [Pseudobdellovibrio sp.]